LQNHGKIIDLNKGGYWCQVGFF